MKLIKNHHMSHMYYYAAGTSCIFYLFFFLGCPPCWVASSLQTLLLVYCFTCSFFFSFLSTRVIILWYFANFFSAYWLLIRTIFRNLGRWDIFTNLFGEELKVVFATDFSENKVKCKKQNIAIADILHINIMNHNWSVSDMK